MFVTDPSFEDRIAPRLGPPLARYWLATTLSLNTPWYLMCWQSSPSEPPQTVLVAWERVLISLLQQMAPMQLLSLRAMMYSPEAHGWTMRRILEIWLPSADESASTGPMLMRLSDTPGLVNALFDEVEARSGRRLIATTMEAEPPHGQSE